jgi:NTP pyrophosphatase (non-canonical NTP hydrolase)
MHSIEFRQLRAANECRLPQFKDRQGNPAHTMSDGTDWTPAEWIVAMVGEVGELAGVLKSCRRGDFGEHAKSVLRDRLPAGLLPEETMRKIRNESADIVTYLDLFCYQFGIDLGAAVAEKFNEVSERVGATTRIAGGTGAEYADPYTVVKP